MRKQHEPRPLTSAEFGRQVVRKSKAQRAAPCSTQAAHKPRCGRGADLRAVFIAHTAHNLQTTHYSTARPEFARYFPVRNRQKKCREPRASLGEEATCPSRRGGPCSRSVLAARSAPLPKPPGVSVQAPIEWLLGRGGMPRRVLRRRYWGAGLAVCAKSCRRPPTLPL